jgi:hypothetical protein
MQRRLDSSERSIDTGQVLRLSDFVRRSLTYDLFAKRKVWIMAFQYVLPHAVTSQLDSLRGRIRRVAFLRGCGLFVTLSCGLLIGTLLIDFLVDLEPASRIAGFVGFCVAEVLLIGFLLVRPLFIRLRDPEVALLAEEKFPELGERVSSLVELADPDIPEDEKGSPLMRDLLEEETLKALAHCDFNEAVSARPAVRRLGYGFGTLSFLILSLLIFPSVSSLLLARLFNPWGNYESVSRLIFDVEGADEFVARGDDIEIVATMTWRNGSDDAIPEPVQLSWRSDDGNSDVRTLSFDPDQEAFTTAIPDVQDSLEFFVSSEGSRSRRYQINVLDRPEVLAAKLEITPPGYLGQPRETLDGVTGEISVFEHSKLTFDLTFSHPVEEASINWLSAMVLPESEAAGDQQVVPSEDEDDEAEAEADIRTPGTSSNSLITVDDLPETQLIVADDGLSARLETPATIQGAFAFLLKESHGLENDSEPYRQFIITRDQPPLLEVPGGEQDRARPTDVYGIRVSAVDDVALEELELHVSSREGVTQVIKAPSELLGQDSLEHEFRIDLSDIAVESGDFLKLQIRAADGRPTPSPNEVWSEVRYVAISDDASAQGTSDVLARQEQIRKELQDIRDQLLAAVEQSDDLRDDARQSLDKDRNFAQQQAVETLAGREEELAARIAELADQFSQHPLFANLSEDLWTMAADELDPAATKLAESPQQELKDQVAAIDENSAVADMVKEGLADVAAEFEKLADLEEDLLELNRIAQRANQLADDAVQLDQHREELAAKEPDATEPLEAEAVQRHEEARQELAENQQLLMEEQSELMAALDNLMQQRPELLEAARDHQLEKLADLARQASEIAEPQELLAQSLEKDAEQARQAAAPLAERQQEITQQIEELAAKTNAQQSRQPVTPIDPELARKIADELLEGNLDQAEELSKQAQEDLAELAKELVENAQLPADPKEAAAELAKRQQALAEEIAAAADSSANQPGADPEAGQEATAPNADLGQLAARQAALQMATAQLQADRQSRDEQQTAVDEAAETLQKLIEAAKQEPADQAQAIAQAAKEGEEAAAAMEQLAENILPEAQQREEALEELQQLRKEDGTDDEELSDEELAARLQDLLDPPQPEPEQIAQQARQLAQAQQQLREETETLADEFVPDSENDNEPDSNNENAANENAANDQARSDAAEPLAEQQAALAEQAEALPAELGALERAEALAQLEQAQQALEQGQLQAAAEAQQQAQQALENFAREADALAQASTPSDPQTAAPGEQPAGDATAQPEPANGQPAGNPSTDPAQPGEQLAAQAEQLADLQQQLQEAIAELAQQPAGNTPPGEQVADAAPSQQSPPANAEPSNAEPGSSEAGTSEPAGATPAAQQADAAPTGQQPNSEPGSSSAPQSLSELLAQQEELTSQAAQLALQSAEQAGAESAATQSAAQSAQQSAQAENAARGGQFAQAASEASDAQQAAAASAEALQESAPALADQAQQLAEQQQQMAEAFEQLENSPAQRAAAQQTQQQQLAAQADQVAQALDELAEQLGAQPLDLQQQGQQASSAQQSAERGQQAASQAAENMQAGNQGQAAQAAQQAADALRESAQQAAANATPSNNSSPVPGEFAAQIAEAMRQLQEAQQQLAQAAADASQAGQPSGQPNSETGEPTAGNSEPGATALDAATGEAAAAQPPSGDSPSNGESAQGQPSQSDPAGQTGDPTSPGDAASESQPGQQSGQPTPGTPGSAGQPSSSQGNQPGQQTQQRNGALAEAADALQQAAEMLSDAAQQLAADGSQSEDNQGQSNQQPSSQQPGLGNSGTGSFADGEIKGPLDTELKRRAMKNWGKLSGNLKTEILQSSQRKANGDYARLIKLYFEELAKAGQSESSD